MIHLNPLFQFLSGVDSKIRRSLLTHFVKLTSAVLIKLGRPQSYLIDSLLEDRDFKLPSTKRFFRAVEKTSGRKIVLVIFSIFTHGKIDATWRRNCTKKRYSYSVLFRTLIEITTGRHQRNSIKSRSYTGTRTWWNKNCTSTITAAGSCQKWTLFQPNCTLVKLVIWSNSLFKDIQWNWAEQ